MKSQRKKFFLQRKTAYFNCAYMSPALRKVENAAKEGLNLKKWPHRISTHDFFSDSETLRLLFSQLIHSSEVHRIAIIPSVSYGMAIVEKNLKVIRNQEIIVVDGQFPSNVYPWLEMQKTKGIKVTVVTSPDVLANRGEIWNEKILAAINTQTAAVCIGTVHWSDGTKYDLKAIRAKTNEVGAALILDGTQSIGALPFSIEEIKPDALICAGYKWLMGAYGMGLAYFGEKFDQGLPIEENWINRAGSEDFARLVQYEEHYQNGALRYDVGEHSNFMHTKMLIEGIKQILSWTPEEIQSYTQSLFKDSLPLLKDHGFWSEDEKYRGNHLFGILPPKHTTATTCAEKLKHNQVYVSVRGNFIRVSPHVYNDDRDVNKMVKILKSI